MKIFSKLVSRVDWRVLSLLNFFNFFQVLWKYLETGELPTKIKYSQFSQDLDIHLRSLIATSPPVAKSLHSSRLNPLNKKLKITATFVLFVLFSTKAAFSYFSSKDGRSYPKNKIHIYHRKLSSNYTDFPYIYLCVHVRNSNALPMPVVQIYWNRNVYTPFRSCIIPFACIVYVVLRTHMYVVVYEGFMRVLACSGPDSAAKRTHSFLGWFYKNLEKHCRGVGCFMLKYNYFIIAFRFQKCGFFVSWIWHGIKCDPGF